MANDGPRVRASGVLCRHSPKTRASKRVGALRPEGIIDAVRLNRIIKKRLRNADGSVIGDVNAAIAVNTGEPGGSETHVSSHSRIVQSTRSAQAPETTRPASPTEADDPKEDA